MDDPTTPDRPSDSSDSSAVSRPRRLLSLLAINRAVAYAIGLRAWQLGSGPVSVLLIGWFFGGDEQGYYYVFASLLGLHTLFDSGLSVVIINVASHEWSQLRLDDSGQIIGDESTRRRLISLARRVGGWYAAAALLYGLLIGGGGAWFLSQRDGDVAWQWPWLAAALLSAMQLALIPAISLLEGCGQVTIVHRFRLIEAVTAKLGVWSCVALGGGLWAAVAAVAAHLFWQGYLVGIRFPRFFSGFRKPASSTLDWRSEVWPLQWRLALQKSTGYLATALAPMVIFQYHSPEEAGQLGMTWTLVTTLHAAAFAWVQTRIPMFGVLIARRQRNELRSLFRRVTTVAIGVVIAGGLALWLLVYALNVIDFFLAPRLLPPDLTALYLAGTLACLISNCQEAWIRAHKQDPFLRLNVVADSLTILLTWWWGHRYGLQGVATAYAGVYFFVVLPWRSLLYLRWKREWDH